MSEDDSVKHESKWTRADLPSWVKIREADDMAGNGLRSRVIDIALNEVVAHLNARFPKRDADALLYRAERAERERDQARKALVEKEDEAVRECRRAYRERDEAVARAEQAESERDHGLMEISEFREELAAAHSRAEKAERVADSLHKILKTQQGRVADAEKGQSAPAVSRADIEKAIRGKVWAANREPNKAGFHRVHVDWATDAVWSLVSGADPAVLVVRESDLPAARVDGDYYVVASAKGDYKWPQHGPSWWAGRAQDALTEAARYTSLALLAAREDAVDPVEAKARAEADRRYSGDPNHAFVEGAVWAARHALGQEGRHADQ